MKTIKIAVIAMMGMSLGANAQWNPNGDSSTTGSVTSTNYISTRNPNNSDASVNLSWSNNIPRIRVGGMGNGVSNGFEIQTTGNRKFLKFDNSGHSFFYGNVKTTSNVVANKYYINNEVVLSTGHNFLYLGTGSFPSGIYTDKIIRTRENIEPYLNLDSQLGNSSKRWSAIYTKDLDVNGKIMNLIPATNQKGIYATSVINKSSANHSQHGLYLQVEEGGGYLINSSVDGGQTKDAFIVRNDGKVGIGTTSTGNHRLAVEGSIGAREIKVEASGWSDFVFDKEYNLPTLKEVENHIKEKGHLKDIPSAKEVERNGFFLGEMDAKLLQKIEELTLYTIEQEKKIKAFEKEKLKIEKQQKEINTQKKEIEELKKQNSRIKNLEKLVQKLLKDKN